MCIIFLDRVSLKRQTLCRTKTVMLFIKIGELNFAVCLNSEMSKSDS